MVWFFYSTNGSDKLNLTKCGQSGLFVNLAVKFLHSKMIGINLQNQCRSLAHAAGNHQFISITYSTTHNMKN